MMEEAQRIFDYLPVSYRNPTEKEDVEFLWDAFLIESQNPDEREFLDDESQIEEIFVNGNYLSFEDIKIAQHYDISVLSVETGFANIQSLEQTLNDLYKEEE